MKYITHIILLFALVVGLFLILLRNNEQFNNKYNLDDNIKNYNSNALISRIVKINKNNFYKKSDLPTSERIDLLVEDLNYFIDNHLDKLKKRVILNILDHPFKSVCISAKNYNNFLNNYKIKKVYAENWMDNPHPKVTIIPIGFESKSFIDGLQNRMIDISKKQKNINSKPLKILCNSHFLIHKNPKSGSYNQRQEVLDKLKNNDLVDFWKNKKTKEETWYEHNNYSFELCPEGNGLDTHRFYEALFLNTIPIVKRNTLESMYRNFPCVIIDSWSEITKENCIKWKNELRERIHSEKYKLNMDYWYHNN
jgi:hypothetical protein